MKSPWKFLVQLTSRARPAETPAASIEHDAKAAAIESEAQRTSALPSSSTEAPDGPRHHEAPAIGPVATTTSIETGRDLDAMPAATPPVDIDEGQAETPAEANQSSAEAPALVRQNATSKKSPRAPQAKRAARAGRTRIDRDAERTDPANEDQTAQSPSPPPTFLDEVGSLDDEVRQLRRQLAHKLHLQNIQLKKMLERFDIS